MVKRVLPGCPCIYYLEEITAKEAGKHKAFQCKFLKIKKMVLSNRDVCQTEPQ